MSASTTALTRPMGDSFPLGNHPFYSPLVRRALEAHASVEVASSSEGVVLAEGGDDGDNRGHGVSDDDDDNNDIGEDRRGKATPGVAIRGKWRREGQCSLSSSEEDDRDKDDSGNLSEDSDSSSSSSSLSTSLAPLPEERERNHDEATQQRQRTPTNSKPSTSSKSSKRHKGKTKQQILQRLKRPPSILIPLPHTSDNDPPPLALEIPSVLLPQNYLRQNPQYRIPTVASLLLSQWDDMVLPEKDKTIVVVLLQSGRFASAVYSLSHPKSKSPSASSTSSTQLQSQPQPQLQLLAHKTSTRYTIRKGQGGSQSSHDQSKGKAKSIGSQLRREGEKQLRLDVVATWKEWKSKGYVDRAGWLWVACPQNMRRDYLFGGQNDGHDEREERLAEKGDGRWRNIPLDVGRPTLEGANAVVECLLGCCVREMSEEERRNDGEEEGTKNSAEHRSERNPQSKRGNQTHKAIDDTNTTKHKQEEEEEPPIPLTPLHEAILADDLPKVDQLLSNLSNIPDDDDDYDYDINTRAGPDLQTPLHLASSSPHPHAPSILRSLLERGRADPTLPDARGRPPSSLASSDKLRDAFRLARATLGEDHCNWDEEAKVGPPLTEDDVRSKKAKALEKKRRQRARQKEKRAVEKALEEEEEQKKREEEEKKQQEEEAKRVRDGLQPKMAGGAGGTACDFCQVVVKGKKRSLMFRRLDYVYCSSDCVKKHQRELMAAAAAARM